MNYKYDSQFSLKTLSRSFALTLVIIFPIGVLLFMFSTPPGYAYPASVTSQMSSVTSPITATTPITVYLPIVLQDYDSALPQLTSPSNGAVLDTLIPTFIWDMGTQPPNTVGCLALDTTPNPTGCKMSFFIITKSQWVMSYNLEPSTVYYWRVGAVYNSDYDNPNWSEERSFTTGPVGGMILPAPVLVSPANNSIVSSTDVTLTWQSVVGAIEYDVLFHALDTDRWFSFGKRTDPQLIIYGFSPLTSMYGHNFDWFVTARNDYAWGDHSASWKFTYSPSTVNIPQWRSVQDTILTEQDGTMVEEIRRDR